MPVFAPFLAAPVAAGMFWLALRFFHFGMARYQGAGS
jgi:ABC-type uncharacterized transport system permease subunit